MTNADVAPATTVPDEARRWSRLARITGAAGLTFPILTLGPIIVASTAGEPDFNGDATAVLAFLRATSSTAASVGEFAFVVGVLSMVWFAVGLTWLLGRSEGTPAWRSAVAAASAVMFGTINLMGPAEAARHRAEQLSPDIGLFAFDMSNVAFANSWVAMGSFALCSGWVVVETRWMPRWLGWLGIAGGIGLALSRAVWTTQVWLLPYLFFWVFVVVCAVRLLRGRTPATRPA